MTCQTCGFSECECQTVIANCNTCTTPIFGREDYSKQVHREAAPYVYTTFTCETCQEAKLEAA